MCEYTLSNRETTDVCRAHLPLFPLPLPPFPCPPPPYSYPLRPSSPSSLPSSSYSYSSPPPGSPFKKRGRGGLLATRREKEKGATIYYYSRDEGLPTRTVWIQLEETGTKSQRQELRKSQRQELRKSHRQELRNSHRQELRMNQIQELRM